MLRIAMGQIDVVPGRPDLNTAAILAMLGQARENGAQLVIFPELSVPGYLLGDTWEQPSFIRDCEEYGRKIVAASQGLCVIFGNVGVDWDKTGDDGRVRKYNAFFTACDGRLVGDDNFPYPFRIKALHPNYREFEDTRHFCSLRKLSLELDVPLKELLQPVTVPLKGEELRIGSLICEDGWYEDYALNPVEMLAENGPLDLYVNISSSPFTLAKNHKRHRVFSNQARESGVPLIYVNNVGLQNNGKTVFTFDGASAAYNGLGQTIARCQTFAAELAYVDIDLTNRGNSLPPTEPPEDQGIDTVYQALRYGTARFLNNIGMERVVIGVSGGIDSAVAAALYRQIVGPENLLLVNMPSRYNSATTKGLAEELAKNLGCLYTVVPIQESVGHTVSQLEGAPIIHTAANAQTHLSVSPFATENIQARDRSARVLAGLAAAFGGGFTCNANKTELTVGYSTLYGDQAGFLAALADLWKHQVYALGRYLNEQVYRAELIPEGTFRVVPSAELSAEQDVDQGKGDPLIYPYHDFLFRAFVEHWNRSTPEDILTWYACGELDKRLGCETGLTGRLFPDPAHFIADLEKWWRLYTGMAVAKRIQAPPVIAISRRAFGFDHREAQNGLYYTLGYRNLKERLLADH